MNRYGWLLLGCLLLGAGLSGWADENNAVTEKVHTADGTMTVYYRTPASAADLGLPLPAGAVVSASLVYRVRDRKERDHLLLARTDCTSTQSAADVRQFYLDALGKEALADTDAKSGEITITLGVKEHARLVSITPNKTGCAVRLEQVQQFTIPPRVYTHDEEQAVKLLNAVAATYQSARAVSYTMTQLTAMPAGTPAAERPPALIWTVSLTRPGNLRITAAAEGTLGLEITSEKDALRVHHQRGKDEMRPIDKTITIDAVPEVGEDPVARMLLGNSLIDEQVEQISMTEGTGRKQDEVTIVLGLPEQHAVATLLIARKRQVVLSCTTVVTEDKQVTTVTRNYSHLVITPAAPTAGALTGR